MNIRYKTMSNIKYALCGGGFGIVLSFISLILAGRGGHATVIPLLLYFAPLVLLSPFQVYFYPRLPLFNGFLIGGVLLYVCYAILLRWGNRRNKGARTFFMLLLFHFGALLLSIFVTPEYWDFDSLEKYLRIAPGKNVIAFAIFAFALFLTTYAALKTRIVEDGVPFCGKCHYNLTGNTSGVCPECGEEIIHDLGK